MVAAVSAPCYSHHQIPLPNSNYIVFESRGACLCSRALTCLSVYGVQRQTCGQPFSCTRYTLQLPLRLSLIYKRSSTVNITTYLNEYLRTGQLSTDDGVDHEPSSATS